MSSISISAQINTPNSPRTVYQAEQDAIVLSSNLISTNPNPTVSYIKRLPSGLDLDLPNLQGTFFGKGSQLILKASEACIFDITLMSRGNFQDHQIVYPFGGVVTTLSDSSIDTNVCGLCASGKRVLGLEGEAGAQVKLTFENREAGLVKNSPIKIVYWIAPTQCPPIVEGIHYKELGIVTQGWGSFIVTFIPPNLVLELSFLAKNINKNNDWDILCFDGNWFVDKREITFQGFAP
jgi:hypothetical protein